MIEKKDLENRAWYLGNCRQAITAQWIEEKNQFVYLREKFGQRFAEYICHPDDEHYYDVFVPLKKLELTREEYQETRKYKYKNYDKLNEKKGE